jgi:hypothetical protein
MPENNIREELEALMVEAETVIKSGMDLKQRVHILIDKMAGTNPAPLSGLSIEQRAALRHRRTKKIPS